ncbi:MAG: glycosyltransferase family 39 protein [Clostridia bacterium]|nr:glycosyltransferase family 39 protein [Clostridia bacterium]
MKLTARRSACFISRIGMIALAILMCSVMLFLSVSSLLYTADMNRNNPAQEKITFESDSLWLNLLFLVVFLALGAGIMYLFRRLGVYERLSPSLLSFVLAGWVVVVGSAWVIMSMSAPTHDSLIVTRAGVAAALGDLSYVKTDYFIRFPFQLGYVLWTEIWARLLSLGHDGYLALEFINVACLAAGEMALVRLTNRLFGRRSVTFATALALAFFFQPVIFCTFLYGTIPGFCFAAWSMLLLMRFLQTDRWRFLIGAGLCLSLAVSLKLNFLILFVAFAVVLLLHALRGRPIKRLLSLLVLCAIVLSLKNVAVWQYEQRADIDLGDGIPMVSWLAMGLHDASAAPGWYSSQYTVLNFSNAGGDSDKAAEQSMEVVKDRLSYLADHPREAADFFSKKIRSQWNEPTYQSIWNNQVRGQYADKTGLAAYVCGKGEYPTKGLMDLGIQGIFCGVLVAMALLLARLLRKQKEEDVEDSHAPWAAFWLVPLYILGGFLYHALFEAKSQYVITYVTLMIPYAVFAARETVCFGAGVARRLLNGRKEKHVSNA